MDLSEMMGVKQVVYDANQLEAPLNYKSPELRRLYQRIRHPSFIGISIILWIPNIMSLDRFMLAIMWTFYMYFAWNTEARDLAYQRNQLRKKKYELTKKLVK